MPKTSSSELYQEYIHKSRYARYLPELNRRETWEETVVRYMDYMYHTSNYKLDDETLLEIKNAILNKEIMPSMRALMTAGPALDVDNIAAYNCAYVEMCDVEAFSEILYILMNGTGVGFSVERNLVEQLPTIPADIIPETTVIEFWDSKQGWAAGYAVYLDCLWSGHSPEWDLSQIRPAGAPLKTFGGRASGPGPLRELLEYTYKMFMGAAGRKLTPLEVHDIVCKIAEVVVVGGVRRSALISLSNLGDGELARAKTGAFWEDAPHRALANNSVVYTRKPDIDSFLREWLNLMESKSGERGIVYRPALKDKADENGRRYTDEIRFGTNPCAEIILRPMQFCNLTEIVARSNDTYSSLKRKVRLATILGTIQSSLTDFHFLRSNWRKNCEAERLLGVSITGIHDCPILCHIDDGGLADMLENLKQTAISVNKEVAAMLGIQPSAAITCVKPSGTVSQLVDASSGIHTRFAPYYIRRVRGDKKDPLTNAMMENGFPWEPDPHNSETVVFKFPVCSPDDTPRTADNYSALEQLELWAVYAKHWCEHKPSCTIYVREDEWLAVGAWVYSNIELVSGLSFLPLTDHVYESAPYTACTLDDIRELEMWMPKGFSFDLIHEGSDMTTASQELACTGGSCELPN